MQHTKRSETGTPASPLILGCRRWASLSPAAAERLFFVAREEGVRCFDHADIYGGGQAESIFGELLAKRPSEREQIILQSKCAIRKQNGHNYYDQSAAYMLEAVDGILRRLRTEYLDILLLHRPDVLTAPEEVAEAFDRLHASGKVRQFGVSNYGAMQIHLLQQYLRHKIVIDQVQASLAHPLIVSSCFTANMCGGVPADGILDYGRLNNIALQIWSPLQMSDGKTLFLGNEQYAALNAKLAELGEAWQATPAAIAIAWLLRIPAGIQVVTGTTDPQHLKSVCRAAGIRLTRADWYDLYHAAGHPLP